MKPFNLAASIGLSMLLSWTLSATPEQEGRDFGRQQHEKRYEDKSADIEALKQEFRKKPENQDFQPQLDSLSNTFEGNFEGGRKGEDPLKSHLGQKTTEASKRKHDYQPTLGETETLLKQKQGFKIGDEDPLLIGHQEISETELDGKEASFQAKRPSSEPSRGAHKIITCRKGVKPELRSCEKRLVVKAVPQIPLVKIVNATFTARCYNLVDFDINLKTGIIGVYNCENRGPVNISVDNPIGEPDYPEQVTVKLIDLRHYGETGVQFTPNMTPSYANGFQGSFRAFQKDTSRKKSHTNNKNNVRGGWYQWEITMPRKPRLEETWEGCEDLERKTTEKTCELVELEKKDLNETRVITGYPESVTRAHWLENHTYLCNRGSNIDECEALIRQKCEQIDSRCGVYKGDHCVEYKNTFRCGVVDDQKGDHLSFSAGKLSFLSPKGERTPEFYPNADFGEAITHFNAATEMGKPMEDGLGGIVGDPNNPSVFKGKCSQCRKNLGSFVRDCCELKGVLQGLGLLGGCNEEEKKLAVADVKHKRCVKVGRYCHHKIAKVCMEERDAYCCYGSQLAKILQEIDCCYGSQLAKILQEIAHQQLGLAWGEAKKPLCESLSASQLGDLNFDTPYAQQKLSEIIGEVQATAQEKSSRVQQAVSAAKSLQVKTQEWASKQAEDQKKIQRQMEKQGVNK